MPVKKKDAARAVKDSMNGATPSSARGKEDQTLDSKIDISKDEPSVREQRHRFVKLIDGKKVAESRRLKYKQSESRDKALIRFKNINWIDDNTQYHEHPNAKEIHEGDADKCPICTTYLKANDGAKAQVNQPTSHALTSVDDVRKAWTQIPAGTMPYIVLVYVGEDVVLPLIEKTMSVSKAVLAFEKARRFMKEKPTLKVKVEGKTESHVCPNAYQVKVRLSADMRSVLTKLDISGWAPVLRSTKEELSSKKFILQPKLEVAYLSQSVKPELVDYLKESFGLKDFELDPIKEDKDGRNHKERDQSDKELSDSD